MNIAAGRGAWLLAICVSRIGASMMDIAYAAKRRRCSVAASVPAR
jgi:hypothetical protein